MKSKWASWTRLGLLALAAPTFVGCGGGESTTPTAQKSEPAAAAEKTAATSTVTIVKDGASTPAAESVGVFLDSLRRGNEAAANGVLTIKAREEIAKTDFVMQPLGAPEGSFNIGRVSYPYETQDIALVECSWQDPPSAEVPQPEPVDIVCEVRQEPEGWRISGIAVGLPGTEETLVLDFEDAAALQATLGRATGAPAASQASAGQTQQQGTAPGNMLPALPQLPSGGQAPTSGGNVQIALPQLPNTPVQR